MGDDLHVPDSSAIELADQAKAFDDGLTTWFPSVLALFERAMLRDRVKAGVGPVQPRGMRQGRPPTAWKHSPRGIELKGTGNWKLSWVRRWEGAHRPALALNRATDLIVD